MSDATADFIEAVRALPALWDKADADFKDGKRKPQMWADLAEAHDFEGMNRSVVVANLSDVVSFQTARRRRSGGPTCATSWAYYGIMSFLDGSLEPRKGRVSSLKSQQLVPGTSQLDLFEDEDIDSSFGDSSKDTASLNGAPTPKRIKQEKLDLEKRFINAMEATALQLQSASSEESAEQLFGRTIG